MSIPDQEFLCCPSNTFKTFQIEFLKCLCSLSEVKISDKFNFELCWNTGKSSEGFRVMLEIIELTFSLHSSRLKGKMLGYQRKSIFKLCHIKFKHYNL